MHWCCSAPRPAAGSRTRLFWMQTGTQRCLYFFSLWDLFFLSFYFEKRGWQIPPIVCIEKCSYPGKQIKTSPQMDDFSRKMFQPAPYLWRCIPVLWFLMPYNGECFRERLFELYKPPAHTRMWNNNNSLKRVNAVTCPPLVIPFICVSPLSVHRFPILFSRRWPRLKVYCGWLFRKVPLSKSASN